VVKQALDTIKWWSWVIAMPENNLFQDSKAFVSSMLRALEIKRAGGDADKLREIGELSDDETLRKWLWTVAVIGAPTCFLGVPVLLCLLGIVIPNLMTVLWFVAKVLMGLVLVVFAIAAYLTWRKDSK
jgi:hypothetical protein